MKQRAVLLKRDCLITRSLFLILVCFYFTAGYADDSTKNNGATQEETTEEKKITKKEGKKEKTPKKDIEKKKKEVIKNNTNKENNEVVETQAIEKKQKELVFLFSKDFHDDIAVATESSLARYTKENPFIQLYMPIKPKDIFDAKTNVGVLIERIINTNLDYILLMPKGRITYKIIKNNNDSHTVLHHPIDKNRSSFKSISSTYNADIVISGFYEGDDSSINLVIYAYSKKDDVIITEKIKTSSNFMKIMSLNKNIKTNQPLTKGGEKIPESVNP